MSILFTLGVSSTPLYAQSAEKQKTINSPQPVKKEITKAVAVKKTTLDTEESFKFLGNQLLFQVKKRLNLTTEEEEKNLSKSTANKKFSFFGIEVERD